jgi:MFS family permease
MDGHSLPDTAAVIRAHVLAMYVPSLASGWLISRLGERRLMLAGLSIYAVTLIVGLAGQELMHYTGSMVLLGVGWNFLFVGGTTLLVQTYPERLRYRAQSINEAAVFGTSALGSLLAGTVLSAIGWQAVLLATLPAIFAMTAAVIILLRRPLPAFHGIHP